MNNTLKVTTILIIALSSHFSCDEREAVDHTETDLEANGFGGDGQSSGDGSEEVYTYITVKGHYVSGFESSFFYPCGSDEQWWVYGGLELARKYADVATSINEHLFVRFYGARSELGRYGHLGGGDRSFNVERIIEIRKRSDRDCEL